MNKEETNKEVGYTGQTECPVCSRLINNWSWQFGLIRKYNVCYKCLSDDQRNTLKEEDFDINEEQRKVYYSTKEYHDFYRSSSEAYKYTDSGPCQHCKGSGRERILDESKLPTLKIIEKKDDSNG